MEKILISRCLLGHAVRYDGGASGPFDQLAAWQAEGRVVAICPEVAGGLPTPRPSAEIPGGQGIDVWEGRAQVLTAAGEDFSAAFLDGARQALALVQRHMVFGAEPAQMRLRPRLACLVVEPQKIAHVKPWPGISRV